MREHSAQHVKALRERAEVLYTEAKALEGKAKDIEREERQLEISARVEANRTFRERRKRILLTLRESHGLTFAELGRRFSISGGRARQIYLEALSDRKREEHMELKRRLSELETLRKPLRRYLLVEGEEPENLRANGS